MYGLLGYPLSHSYSRILHGLSGDDTYTLFSLSENKLAEFFKTRLGVDVAGVNVTIPYKEAVIPFLDELTDTATKTRAVNTVFIKNGKRVGANTDAVALSYLLGKRLSSLGLSGAGRTAAVLGSGGAGRTAAFVLEKLGLKVVVVSRKGEITYDDKGSYENADVLINATPVGTFPHADETPMDLSGFSRLKYVFDFTYHPLSTRLLQDAAARNIACDNGLSLLVLQGLLARALFSGKRSVDGLPALLASPAFMKKASRIESELLFRVRSVVLIGAAGAGKTTVGRLLAKMLNRPFLDTDELVTENFGTTPEEIIRLKGEAAFRLLESDAVKTATEACGAIIAVGGGAPTTPENAFRLRQNALVVYLKTSPERLETKGRPLYETVSPAELLSKREPLYFALADAVVTAADLPEETAKKIEKLVKETL